MHPLRLLLLVALFLSSSAKADIAPSWVDACESMQSGASCKTEWGHNGSCQWTKCSRRDYSKGFPPGFIEYDCLRCFEAGPLPQRASSTAPASEPHSAMAPALVPATTGMSWTALPWLSLALMVLVTGWLMSRRRSQRA